MEWFPFFLEHPPQPGSTSPLWHCSPSSFRLGRRTSLIRFEPSPTEKLLADATPPLPCFYPHSEWAVFGARCNLGSDHKPQVHHSRDRPGCPITDWREMQRKVANVLDELEPSSDGDVMRKRKRRHWQEFIETPSSRKARQRSKSGLCIGCGKHPCECSKRRKKA